MNEQAQRRSERNSYIIGYGLAIVLTALPFLLVALDVFPMAATLIAITLFALVQIVVHFRFFLHINLSKSKRDDLQLILFTGLIIALMVAGTLWILFNLKMRMM